MKAYLANGLFSQADQMFNKYLADEIRKTVPGIDLYVPQENESINDKKSFADSIQIYDGDNQYLDNIELLITVLDGVEIDSGVSAEIGRYVKDLEVTNASGQGKKKYVVGLFTDVRQQGRDNQQKIDALIEDATENQFVYRNLYVIGGIKKNGKLFDNVEDLVDYIKSIN